MSRQLESLKRKQATFLAKQLALDEAEERDRAERKAAAAAREAERVAARSGDTLDGQRVKTNLLFSAVDIIRHASSPVSTLDLLCSLRLCNKATQARLLVRALQRNPDIVWRPNRVDPQVAVTKRLLRERGGRGGVEEEEEKVVVVGGGEDGTVQAEKRRRRGSRLAEDDEAVLFWVANGIFQFRTVLGGIRTSRQLERALGESSQGITLAALTNDGFAAASESLADLAASGRALLLPTLDLLRTGPRAVAPSPHLSLALSTMSESLCLFFWNSSVHVPGSVEEVERELRERGLPVAKGGGVGGGGAETEREGVYLKKKKRRKTKRTTTLHNTHVEGMDFSRDYSAKAGLAAVVARKRREEEARAAAAMDAAIPE